MGTDSKRRLLVISLVTVLVVLSVFPMNNVGAQGSASDVNVGPYIDEVVYITIENPDQSILALQAEEVDIIAEIIDPIHHATVQEAEHLSITSILRNGYGHFTFNCRKYPFNLTAFRRAFAYAFDKTRVTSEVFLGLSQEHDSVVPYVSGWCIEDELPYNYYTAQVALGNQLLDEAGFVDPGPGSRRTPDGSPFNLTIFYPSISPVIAADVAQIGVDAFTALGIDASVQPVIFDTMLSRIHNNRDYDIAFFAYNFQNYDVYWLADEFWGELADVPRENPSNFRNVTFDSWRNQLLYSTEYEDVYEAAAAMQLILHEQVPIVVAYQNIFLQAYRSTIFTGFVEDVGRGIDGPWTLRKVHRIDGNPGGTLRIAVQQHPDSFNIFVDSNSAASSMLAEVWPSLYLRGPDLQPYPYLAEQLLTETHSDNPSVERGRTRFTIDIIRNATWDDGIPLTAEDVIFSLKYSVESGVHGNPAGESLTNLVAAYAPSTYRAVIEFDTETYWHFSKFAYDYIIPMHIFNDKTGFGYEGWNMWGLSFGNASAVACSGPFSYYDDVEGEFSKLTVNPDFCYYPEERLNAQVHLLLSNPVSQLFSEVGVIAVLLVGFIIVKRRKSL